MRKSPGFAAVAILTLALGVGANTAIFSLVDGLLLRSLPVTDPQQLANVSVGLDTANGPSTFSYATFDQIRKHREVSDGALAYNCCSKAGLSITGQNEIVDRMWVSGDFFSTLGVRAFIGRTITPEDDVPGGGSYGPTVVISYQLWQRRFAGSASIIGRPITIERIPVTVVGVAPPEFFGLEVGRTVDLMLPIRTEPLILPAIPFSDDSQFLNVMIRLKREQSLAAASAALRAVQPHIRGRINAPSVSRRRVSQRAVSPDACGHRPVSAPTTVFTALVDSAGRRRAGLACRVREYCESDARPRSRTAP